MLSLLRVACPQRVVSHARCQLPKLVQQASSSATANADRFLTYGTADPGPQFLDADNQSLLKSLTRLDVSRVFRKRSVKETTLQFKFMTTEQIQEEVETALRRAEVKLQMPPVMKVKEEEIKTLSIDPALKDFDDSDYVFTDITYGIPDTDRTIVIRGMDGSLSTASLEARKRLNQFYFPLHGRQVRTPKLFEGDNLKAVLAKDGFEFILDAVCIQFEPYERQFHEISATVYEYIDEHRKFDHLRSTRHFGPMTFFLAWHRQIDNLLLDLINRNYLDNCVDLVELTCKLNKWTVPSAETLIAFRKLNSLSNDVVSRLGTESQTMVDAEIDSNVGKTAEQLEADRLALNIIKQFVQDHGVKKVQLELAIQSHAEQAESQRRLLEGIQLAHGMGSK